MDEQEYKSTYNSLTPIRCVFEKAMCSLVASCSKGEMFRLADRHGYSCQSGVHQKQCEALLNHLRKQTRFVFKLNEIDGPLPHNKEIRVQNGGLLGLQKALNQQSDDDKVADVALLVSEAVQHWGGIESLPYGQLMQSVMTYQARPKRRSRK